MTYLALPSIMQFISISTYTHYKKRKKSYVNMKGHEIVNAPSEIILPHAQYQ